MRSPWTFLFFIVSERDVFHEEYFFGNGEHINIPWNNVIKIPLKLFDETNHALIILLIIGIETIKNYTKMKLKKNIGWK